VVSGKSDILEIVLHKHHETPKAFLVSETGDDDKAVWLPKSQVEEGDAGKGGTFTYLVPEWLTNKNGLI
jgi:hypothetical protein